MRAITGEEPEATWIALVPGDYPARLIAGTKVHHLADGIAWPGPHPRDGTAKIAHDACCPGLHATEPVTSRGAGELWRAMRLRLARRPHPWLPHHQHHPGSWPHAAHGWAPTGPIKTPTVMITPFCGDFPRRAGRSRTGVTPCPSPVRHPPP
ncbi:DUF6083 domain-containing protein [Streptomyces sp. enrichment culture]|uniref:DUF6083 domain-containing protein n=1 Tax=Streptomyces sp. enrichment culture TaxID=1795815 RepID=UPI003F55A1D2